MAFRLIWSPTARLDLHDLVNYIAADSPAAAKRFAQRIFETIERLQDFPLSGRMVPELEDPAVREVIQRPCRIVYRLNEAEKTVEVARVWHAARGTPHV